MPEDFTVVEPRPLDPAIADVSYASETPEQQPEQTNITHIPADQGPTIEQGGPAPEQPPTVKAGTPTLDEIKEYNKINGIVNPILDLGAGDIADLATNDPGHFNLEQSLIELKPHWNSELINKAADAYNLLERRGGRLPSDLGISKLPGMVAETGVGLAKYASKVAKSLGVPFAVAMEEVDKLMGLPPSPAAIAHRQKLTQEASEAAAASEASVTGLAFQGSKAFNKIFGKNPELKTQQEKVESLKAALIPHLAQQEISKGGGLIAPSAEVQAESPIRPEEVEKTIAGDPVGFVLFGKGLEGVSGLVGVGKAATKFIPGVSKIAPVVEAVTKKIPTVEGVGGGAVTLAGKTAEGVARGAEVVARYAPLAGAVIGAASNPLHAIGKIAFDTFLGTVAKHPLEQLAQVAGKGARAITAAGKEIAGKEATTGAITQGVKDVLQSIPDAAGNVAHGAALDLGLAALTSTTPEDQQGLQLGTILGLAQGARRTGSWVVSGQRIAPRAWGSNNGPVQSSGNFPSLDAMHRAAYSSETPAVRQRVDSVREFLKGVGIDADVFLADRNHTRTAADGRVVNTDIENALSQFGADYAENAAKQSGMFLADLPDKNGQPRRAIILADADAAPHEAKHAFQDVIGEQANQVIDKVIRETYGDQWEQIGQSYAEKLLGRKLGPNESWRDAVVDASGQGDIWARNSLDMKAANDYAAQHGAFPKPGEIGETPPTQRGSWRNILTADEAGQVADRYLSREIAADTFEAVFKNLGASLKEKTGLVPWLAKVVANTTEFLGGDSLAGRRGELGTTLDAGVVEAIKKQVRGRQAETPEVTPRTEGFSTPPIAPRPAAPTPTAPPGTPEEEAKITKDVASSAPVEPTGPEINAQSQRDILGTFAEAKAAGQGVKITRRSAPGTPAGAIEVGRDTRRRQVELARGIPDDQKPLWEKNFTPVKTVRLNDGSIQEQGWSPEVLAANAEKAAKFLAGVDPTLSPFEIDTAKGTFTPEGWKQLFDKVNTFAGNQAAGLTGKGTPLEIGKARAFGFFEPTGNRIPVGTLTDAEMNFINYLFGYPLPGKGPAVKQRGSKQYGVQKISEATEPGRAQPLVEPRTFESKEAQRLGFQGKQVLEVNPLRAEIEAAARKSGKDAPSLIEAWQNLNLRDIVRADIAPELPAVRPVGVTLRAGFKPATKQNITVTGPDGKEYKARFDGYYDLTSLGKGFEPAITALEDLPGSLTEKSSGMGKSLTDAGYKLPELPTPEATAFKPQPTKESPKQDYDLERTFAKDLISDKKSIEQFPYYNDYVQTIKSEAPLLKGSENILFVGGGPVPLSPILLSKELGVPVHAIDISKEAVDLGNRVSQKLGADVSISQDSAEDFKDYKKYDAVVLALEAGTSTETKKNILDSISKQVGPKTKILARGSVSEGEFPVLPKEFEKSQVVSTFGGAGESALLSFKPKVKKGDELKFEPTSFGTPSKAWILPNGKVEQLGAQWHHDWLDQNKDIQKKYGLKVPPFEGGDTEGVREAALKKGFARVNLADSVLTVEAREKDWKNIRPIVEDMIDKNIDDVDRFRVQLLNDKIDKVTRTFADKLFDADTDKEKMGRVFDAFSEKPPIEPGGMQFKPSTNPKAIKQPAVRDEKTGEVHVGMIHAQIVSDLAQRAVSEGKYNESTVDPDTLTDGFVTNEGEFLNRDDAFQRATEINQITQEGKDRMRARGLPRTLESRAFTSERQFKPKELTPPTQAEFDDPETIKDALAKPGWAILTATQEKVGPWSDPKNIQANKDLEADLKDKGYEYFPVEGKYKGEPQGDNFLVMGISPYDAQTLGKKYGQESVMVPRGLLYGDGTITPANVEETVVGPAAKKEDFYSTTPGGVDFSVPLDFEHPYKPVGEQEQLFGGREYVSPAQLTQAELKERHPEAIVPKKGNEKIDSDIVGSPLYKKSADPVQAFGDKLVEFAKSFESNPVYQLGLKWYSDFVPILKKQFGKDAPIVAELLAASSPNEQPSQNFFYAMDALEGFKSGRFDKIIDKYNQGWKMMESDQWKSWYNKELKAGNVVEPPATPTPESFMAHWIYKHGLKPLQSNGKLYGFHGKAILEVMARRWLENNQGPKVANFVQNLLGIGHGATIDVWADRTMRRLGYADSQARWRILPKNATGVSDADFAFSQKAFEHAAKKLGITADALQGGLWFAEKQLWADNGWGRLDLGSYIDEMKKLPIIQKSIKQRLNTTALKKKAVPMEQTGLGF